jgi:cytochrome c-type biogenesis protein CcmE
MMLAAVVYLIFSGMLTGTNYFITVEDLVNSDTYVGETVRITGAVIGETIEYDAENLILDFTIAHIPEETDDLALALYTAVNTEGTARIPVHIENEVMPDLLQNEAQAILTGHMGEDGVFYASELLLKCPSRYEEALPDQVAQK